MKKNLELGERKPAAYPYEDERKPAAYPETTSVIIEEVSQLVNSQAAIQASEDKLEDLKTLASINNLIEQFLNAENRHTEILCQIGCEAKKIKFKDLNSTYIRNKYGLIDRSNKAARRENGLELNHLEVLEKIFDNSEFVSEEQLRFLTEGFGVIKQKIALILEAEKDSPTKDYGQVLSEFSSLDKTTNFKQEVGNLYIEKIKREILAILKHRNLASLNFSNKEDRYYFGNVLIKIGELSREFMDFANIEKNSGLFGFFKRVRNLIVHSPSVMIDDSDSDLQQSLSKIENELFPKLIQKINNLDLTNPQSHAEIDEAETKLRKEILSSFQNTKLPAKKINNSLEAKEEDVFIKNKEEINLKLSIALSELEYLATVQNNATLTSNKKNHISQFCMAKIALCLNGLDKISDSPLQTHTSNVPVFRQSLSETIAARNKGIAHDILGFDKEGFSENVKNNVLTISENLEALRKIFNFDQGRFDTQNAEDFDIKSLDLALGIASCHNRLTNYREAEDILNKCLSIVANKKDLKTNKEQQSEYLKYYYGIFHELALIYLEIKKYGDAIKLLNEVAEYEEEISGSISSEILLEQYAALYQLGREQEAQEKLIIIINESKKSKYTIHALNYRAKYLEGKGLINEAKRIYEILDQVVDLVENPIAKIIILINLAVFENKQSKDQKTSRYLEKARNILEEHKPFIKKNAEDWLLIIEKRILQTELQIFKSYMSQNQDVASINFDEEIIKPFNKLYEKIEAIHLYNQVMNRVDIEDFICASFSLFSKPNRENESLSDTKKLLDVGNKLLSLMKIYEIEDLKSRTLLEIGSCYITIATNHKNPEYNWSTARKFLESVKNELEEKDLPTLYLQLAKCDEGEGKIDLALRGYLNVMRMEKANENEKEAAAKFMKQLSDKNRIFKKMEQDLTLIYNQTKGNLNKKELVLDFSSNPSENIEALIKSYIMNLTQYLKEVLNHDIAPSRKGNTITIKLTQDLKKALEEKIAKRNQSAGR
ncbi:MAG: hypothetical protein SFV53_01845 [Rickettsiales bacterium]|nr:hypothetical protein [Rickettsiales bacterium]